MSHCSLQMPYLSPIMHFDFDVHFQHVFPQPIWGGHKRWLRSNGPWHLMHSWLSNFPIGYGKHFQLSVKRNHASITPFDKIWHCLVHPLYIHTFKFLYILFMKYANKKIGPHLLIVGKNYNSIIYIIGLCLFWKPR
jgi:hypothetical protein